MKKSKCFYFLSLFFLINFGSISCSHENETDESVELYTLKRSSNKLDALRTNYNGIVRSELYISYRANVRVMVAKLKGVDLPQLQSKKDFEDWIIVRLGNTHFSSVNEALQLYDVIFSLHRNLFEQNELFFTELNELSDEDYGYVIQDDIVLPPVVSNATPCQNGCMDNVSGLLDHIEMQRAYHNRWYMFALNLYDYEAAVDNAISGFNDCMNAC